jgi:hypothetical protein
MWKVFSLFAYPPQQLYKHSTNREAYQLNNQLAFCISLLTTAIRSEHRFFLHVTRKRMRRNRRLKGNPIYLAFSWVTPNGFFVFGQASRLKMICVRESWLGLEGSHADIPRIMVTLS